MRDYVESIVRYYRLRPEDRPYVKKHFPHIYTYVLCAVCENKVDFSQEVFLSVTTHVDSDVFYKSKKAVEDAIREAKTATFFQLMGSLRMQSMWGFSSRMTNCQLHTICSETCFNLSVISNGYVDECLDISK